MASWENLFNRAEALYPWLQDIRRELHQIPETGIVLDKTGAKVISYLAAIGIETEATWCKGDRADGKGSGIVFDIVSGDPKEENLQTVLLRGDMDALPIVETADVPFKSLNGNMHACGHDSHTTMLLGAARLLMETKGQWKGVVRLLFQPGEEGHFGAHHMVREGLLTHNNRQVKAAFALHVNPSLPTGIICSRGGSINAGGQRFSVKLEGIGGHFATPNSCIDPIPALASLIQQVQAVSARETLGGSGAEVGIMAITQIHTDGFAAGAIPQTVEAQGYLRSASIKVVEHMAKRLQSIVNSLKDSFRINGVLDIRPIIYPVVNDDALFAAHESLMLKATVKEVKVPESYITYTMEDFGEIAANVPAVMYSVGTGSGQELPGHAATTVSLHSPNFALDERILPRGAAFLASLAINELTRLNN